MLHGARLSCLCWSSATIRGRRSFRRQMGLECWWSAVHGTHGRASEWPILGVSDRPRALDERRVTFTKVGPGTVTRSITSASTNQTVLHVVVEKPTDRTDKDEFDLTLVNPTHATLRIVGLPFMPWPL